jgi:hypothetical protein
MNRQKDHDPTDKTERMRTLLAVNNAIQVRNRRLVRPLVSSQVKTIRIYSSVLQTRITERKSLGLQELRQGAPAKPFAPWSCEA